MITRTTEYALRAMVLLAENKDSRLTLPVIAAHTKVPASYLSKVLQNLVHSGLVSSLRGPVGGFTLALPPTKITIFDVVQSVDPFKRIVACPLNLPEHEQRLCALHRKLDRAMALVEKSFRGTTLAQLRENPSLVGIADSE